LFDCIQPVEKRAVLAKDKAAKAAWDKLSFSVQRQHAEPIAAAKAEDTKARRVAKTIDILKSKT